MGRKSETITPDDPFWDIEAYYLAQSAWTASLFLAPEVIVYGGGVSNVPDLLPKFEKNSKN